MDAGIRERLVKFARVQYGLGMTRFEQYVGLTEGTIHKINDGMSTRNVEKIMKKCPELNLEWLIMGTGAMLRGAPKDAIPLLPFNAVAGYLSDNNTAKVNLDDVCVVPDFASRGAQFAIRVDGDSMYPRFRNGEILALKVLDDPKFFQWGKVYVLSTTQGCVVKKLYPDPNDDDSIICRSENNGEYPDYSIHKSDILHIAIVVGHIGLD